MRTRTLFLLLPAAALALWAATVNGNLHVAGVLSAALADFRNAGSVKLLPVLTLLPGSCQSGQYAVEKNGSQYTLKGCGANGTFQAPTSSQTVPVEQSWVADSPSGTVYSEMAGALEGSATFSRIIVDGPLVLSPPANNSSVASECTVQTGRDPVPGCKAIGTASATSNVQTNYCRMLFRLPSAQSFANTVSWKISFRMYGPGSSTSQSYAKIGLTTDPTQTAQAYGLRFYGSSVRAEGNGTTAVLSSVSIANAWSVFEIEHQTAQPGRVSIRQNGTEVASICPSGCTVAASPPSASAWYFCAGGFSGSSPATVLIPYDYLQLTVQ